MALLYRPFYRRNPSLAEVTPEGMLDLILGRLSEGHRAILLPYREILTPRVARILAETRAERQRDVDAQLPPEAPTGGVGEILPVLPIEESGGSTKGTGLHGWEAPTNVPIVMARKTTYATVIPFFRKRLASFSGGPYTFKKQVEPSVTHPGYLDARVTIKAGNGQDYARGVFTFIPKGQRGPVGFVPNGVRVLGKSQDGQESEGELHWPIDDRERAPTTSYIIIRTGYSKGGQITPETWVQVREDPEDAALAMALLVAGTNAEACHRGDKAYCMVETSNFADFWPPKARAKSGQYTPNEFKGAMQQVKDLPEVLAAYDYFQKKVGPFGESPNTAITTAPDISSYLDWTIGYAQLPTDLQTYQNLRRIRTEPGDEQGHVDFGKSTLSKHGNSYSRITIPAFVQKVKKQADAVADILSQATPEAAILATQKWGVGYSYLEEALTRMGFPSLKDTLERHWTSWPDRLLAGTATWADYLKAGIKHYRETLWPPGTTKKYAAEYEVLRSFVNAMDKATPGVFTHAPTRTRFLAQYALDLHIDIRRNYTSIWIDGKDEDENLTRVNLGDNLGSWKPRADATDEDLIRAIVAGALAALAISFDAFRWPRMKQRGVLVIKQEGKKPWPPVPLYGKPQDLISFFDEVAYRRAQFLLYRSQHPDADLDLHTFDAAISEKSVTRLQPYFTAGKQQAVLELFYFDPSLLGRFNTYIKNNQPLPLDLWILYRRRTDWRHRPWVEHPIHLPRTVSKSVKHHLITFDQLPTVLALTWDWINNYPQGTTDPKGPWIRQLLDLSYSDWPPKIT